MSFDLRRFQFLLGTPCECENIAYTDESGAHVAVVRCCVRCWEVGLMSVQADRSRQRQEVELRQLELEVDRILEPTAPATA